MKGQLRSLIPNKFFGFIRAGELEYFFHKADFSGHWEDLETDHKKNEKVEVEFDIGDSPKGPRARNVRRVGFPDA